MKHMRHMMCPNRSRFTGAKRRRESEGESPSGRFGRQPNVTPIPKREAPQSKNQGAKRNLIP